MNHLNVYTWTVVKRSNESISYEEQKFNTNINKTTQEMGEKETEKKEEKRETGARGKDSV